jgi:eukaryotic-like serine/threonine-protein kinase
MDAVVKRVGGRYAIYSEIAAGGMATVHFGRLLGPVGFARTVAVKRLHPVYSRSPEFVCMFLDEARLAARVRHPNVVQTLDVIVEDQDVYVVMDYVQGETLARVSNELRTREEAFPLPIARSIMISVLNGLHAAHEARSERGEPLGIVHRDVSPQNVLVGIDGVARVLDFGVAKAAWRAHSTRDGEIKGKVAYMAPEQLVASREVDRRADVYAAGVMLWEILVGERLVSGDNPGNLMAQILWEQPPPPSKLRTGIPPALDEIVLRAVAKEPHDRYATAREFCAALEKGGEIASAREVGEWLEATVGRSLLERAIQVEEIESSSSGSGSRSSAPQAVEPSHVTDTAGTSTAGLTHANDRGSLRSEDGVPSSLSSQVHRSRPRRSAGGRLAIALAWAGAIATLGAVALAAVGTFRAAPRSGAGAPGALPSIPPTAAASRTDALEPPPGPTAPDLAASPDHPVSASAPPAASVSPRAQMRAPGPPAPAAPKGTARGARACNPPFTIDSTGVKVPKPQCF